MSKVTKLAFLILAAVCALCMSTTAFAQNPAVWTQHYDQLRSGANPQETSLTPANVTESLFGKLWIDGVDGDIYAQPLYLPSVTINGSAHSVVYVATENNSVYAFDADNPGPALWQVSLGGAVPAGDVSSDVNLLPVMGITSTPVIDTTTNTIYVVAYTETNSSTQFWKLHALDVTTGAEKFGGPVTITGSASGIAFNPHNELQRPSLGLANGNVYVLFGSQADLRTWYGWAFSYNKSSLAQNAIYITTPGGSEGSFWDGGQGPVIDASGNLYEMTGNGSSDFNNNDYSEAMLKLSPSLTLSDWFMCDTFSSLNSGDVDFGSGGPVGITGTNLVVGSGKEGRLYVVNNTNMGHENNPNHDVQDFSLGNLYFGAPVYWNNTLYTAAAGEPLAAYAYNGTDFNTTPSASSSFTVASGYNSNSAMTVSSNGTSNGILWASVPDANPVHTKVQGDFYALNAANINQILWSTTQNESRDGYGLWAKFTPPTVVNGLVYEPTFSDQLIVYGPLSRKPAPTATASFVDSDSSTEGSWEGVYGGDGYNVIAGATSYPSYATVSTTARSGSWTTTSTDPRALQVPGGSNRVAGFWVCPSNGAGCSYNVDVNLTDGKAHQVGVYALDWDNGGRAETISVDDALTGTPLNTQTVSSFQNGVYENWNISGHVTIVVTNTAGPNAVLSGVFFGPGGTVQLPTVSKVSISPTSVTGGSSATGTVTLSSAAPSGGAVVSLSSNQGAANPGSSVTVASGSTSANFNISTSSVSSAVTATITASYNSSSQTASLTVNPGVALPTVSKVSISPTSVTGGSSATGTVTLSAAAPSGGAVVSLSSNQGAADPGSSVTVASGSTSANFNISTSSVSNAVTATITASYNSSSQNASLTVNPASILATVSSLSISPTSVTGGTSATGTVTLSSAAPSGGAVVSLSSNQGAANPGSSVTVASGSKSANFNISTSSVSSAVTATITATYNSTSQHASLTVNPASGGSLSSGHTYLILNLNSGMAIQSTGGAGSYPEQEPSTSAANQQWTATDQGGGHWKFTNASSGTTLEIYNGVNISGYPVDSGTWDSGTYQQWTVSAVGNGSYKIDNLGSSLLMEVAYGSVSAGGTLDQNPDSGGSSQHWTFQLVN
jgi:hypothetical protein